MGRDLPISVLGNIPGDAVGSAMVARALKWTLPALFADMAHTFGDLGLDFVQVQVAGPPDTVLNLAKRNSARLFETAGDPSREGYLVFPDLAGDKATVEERAAAERRTQTVIDDHLLATELITRQGSIFLQ